MPAEAEDVDPGRAKPVGPLRIAGSLVVGLLLIIASFWVLRQNPRASFDRDDWEMGDYHNRYYEWRGEVVSTTEDSILVRLQGAPEQGQVLLPASDGDALEPGTKVTFRADLGRPMDPPIIPRRSGPVTVAD